MGRYQRNPRGDQDLVEALEAWVKEELKEVHGNLVRTDSDITLRRAQGESRALLSVLNVIEDLKAKELDRDG